MKLTIKKRGDFQLILNTGKPIYQPSFICFNLYDSNIKGQYGIIASKKSFRRAVERNFAKRRIRELIMQANKSFSLPSNSKQIYIARKPITTKTYNNIVPEIINLFTQLQLSPHLSALNKLL